MTDVHERPVLASSRAVLGLGGATALSESPDRILLLLIFDPLCKTPMFYVLLGSKSTPHPRIGLRS